MYTKEGIERRLRITQINVPYRFIKYKPYGNKSYFTENAFDGFVEAYINLAEAPIVISGKLL
ncbi:MAG: hypothetical protein ACI4JS_09805 [Oscillospiraceae bacterium]